MTTTTTTAVKTVEDVKYELDTATLGLNAYIYMVFVTDNNLRDALTDYKAAKEFWQDYFGPEIEKWDDLEWDDADAFASEYAHVDGPNIVAARYEWEALHEINSDAHQELAIVQERYSEALEAYNKATSS